MPIPLFVLSDSYGALNNWPPISRIVHDNYKFSHVTGNPVLEQDLASQAGAVVSTSDFSGFVWPFLPPYKGVIPNPKMVFIFSI